MLTPISHNVNSQNFRANLKSPKLRFGQNDFFINIKGYGKDKIWAKEIIEVADTASRMIRKNRDVETVLQSITLGVAGANSKTSDYSKRVKSGVLRTARLNWFGGSDKEVYTPYETGRYSCYRELINKVITSPLKAPDKNLGISYPNGLGDIKHGKAEKINYSLDYIFNIFNKKIKPFSDGSATAKDLDKINDAVAEIRWVLAHSTPWLRGSDAISNVFMRAIYKSIGVKTYPAKKGVSFDLQAYCTKLSDYKKDFPTYFTKPPVVIE